MTTLTATTTIETTIDHLNQLQDTYIDAHPTASNDHPVIAYNNQLIASLKQSQQDQITKEQQCIELIKDYFGDVSVSETIQNHFFLTQYVLENSTQIGTSEQNAVCIANQLQTLIISLHSLVSKPIDA